MAFFCKVFQPCLLRGINVLPKQIAKCSSSAIQIRPVHPKEAATLAIGQIEDDIRLTSDDYKLMHKLDKNGFFIATTESGEIAGTVAAPRLSETDGFIGFLKVLDDYKGQGLEERLWKTAMDYLKGCPNVSLEVTPGDVESSLELGFKEKWRNGIFKGVGVKLVEQVQSSNVVRHIRDMPFSQIVYYDANIVGYERPLFLQKWTQVESHAASLAIFERDEVVGYGTLRPLHMSNTYRVGPLYCNNTSIAQILMLALLNDIPEKTVYLTSPLVNPSFVQLLEKELKMEQIGETVRMSSTEDNLIPTHKVFGVLSSEIG